MKNFISFPRPRICFFFFFFFFFMFFAFAFSIQMSSHHYISVIEDENGVDQAHVYPKGRGGTEEEEVKTEVYRTGSSLPDCSHACGPCFPCKRVIVSFKCSVSESCPIVYRCLCRGKYYHVPSL